MNKGGFAISGLLYTIMMVFLVFTMMILFDLQNKKTILDELKADTVLAIDDDSSLSAILDRLDVLEVNQRDQLDKIYPVGSIYISVTNTNPASTLGGTWVSWGSGRVPVGVDASQTEFNEVEKTGGATTHTLTAAQMPSHTHTVPAHSHGLNSHTHSIPALSGTAASAGAHTHAFSNGGYALVVSASSSHAQLPISYGYASVTSNGWFSGGHKNVASISSAGAHTHTVTTKASTTGAASGSTANSSALTSGSTGSGGSHNNLQPYITAYMWKRTA